jgi:hypothetical protein
MVDHGCHCGNWFYAMAECWRRILRGESNRATDLPGPRMHQVRSTDSFFVWTTQAKSHEEMRLEAKMARIHSNNLIHSRKRSRTTFEPYTLSSVSPPPSSRIPTEQSYIVFAVIRTEWEAIGHQGLSITEQQPSPPPLSAYSRRGEATFSCTRSSKWRLSPPLACRCSSPGLGCVQLTPLGLMECCTTLIQQASIIVPIRHKKFCAGSSSPICPRGNARERRGGGVPIEVSYQDPGPRLSSPTTSSMQG